MSALWELDHVPGNAHEGVPPTDTAREHNNESSVEAEPLMLRREPVSTVRLMCIFACIGVGLFLSLMDTTIVATMLYQISEEFGGFRLSPWIVLSYTLSYVGFSVIFARLSDVMGRKPMVLASFALFLSASMACAASKTMNQIVGFRAAQGAGGAGLYALTMIIYPEVCPPNMIPGMTAAVGIVVAIAGVSGPVLGGGLTTYADWRWGFWINGPAGIVPMVLLIFIWPKNMVTFNKVPFKHLDYVGTVLILGCTVLLVFILNQAAIREYAWNSGPTISLLTISGLCCIAMVVWQREIARNRRYRRIQPQYPWAVLTDRVMMGNLFASVITGFVLFLAVVHIPMRAQIVNVYDAVKSGLLLLPLMGSMAVGSMVGGIVSAKRNNTFWTLNTASVLMLVGSGVLSTLGETLRPQTKQWGFEAILGFGLGINMATATFITSLQVPFEYHAVAQGILAQLRVFGGSIGVASGFIVLNKNIQSNLSDVLSTQQLEDFYRSPAAIYKFTLFQQLRVRQVYVGAFNTNMRVCLGLSAIALVASLCTFQRKPPSPMQRLADLEKIYAQTAALDAARPSVAPA